MTEYISREAAISHPFANGQYDHAHANQQFIRGHESYKEWIENLPAADVKPVVRGEWNEIERGGLLTRYALFRCTHCGNIFKVYEDTLNAGRGDKNFCPNCGADMRKEATDDSNL